MQQFVDLQVKLILIDLNKDGYTFGKLGQTSLGDLVTIINSYDETAGYSSNSLSAYFHELADSRKLNQLVQSDWLGIGKKLMFDFNTRCRHIDLTYFKMGSRWVADMAKQVQAIFPDF